MYGFIIPNAGRDLITTLLAGETLILTRCMVGAGSIPPDTDPATLTDLIQPVAQATSTEPLVNGNQVDLTVEYRNDLNGGLDSGFYINEFGIFARNSLGQEVMIYYGNLGDYPQWVQAYTNGTVEVRRFPVAIGVSNTPEVILEYHADAFMTAEDVAAYCTTVMLPLFLEEVEKRIAAHNTNKESHPDIRNRMDRMAADLELLKLQYGTDVNQNPFIVTFPDLSGLLVTGVWNKLQERMEF